MDDLAQAFRKLLVTGYDTSNVAIGFTGDIVPDFNLTVTGTAYPKLLGPLGDLFTIMNIPGQEAQYLTDLMPPSILKQISQNFTNELNALTVPSIEAQITIPVFAPQTGFLSASFGLPLVLTSAAAGPPFATLDALATSLTTFEQALATGNGVGAVGTLIDAPAFAVNGFLNGQTFVDDTILASANSSQ